MKAIKKQVNARKLLRPAAKACREALRVTVTGCFCAAFAPKVQDGRTACGGRERRCEAAPLREERRKRDIRVIGLSSESRTVFL
jgi:hypothetical protein